MNENDAFNKQKIEQKRLFDDYLNNLNESNKKVAEYKLAEVEHKLARDEWLKKNKKRFHNPADLEGIPLVSLKLMVAEMDAREEKGYTVLFIVLVLITVAVIAYFAKAYLLLYFTVFALLLYGAYIKPKAAPNPNMICPHCKTQGQVFTESVNIKKGVSGGKATGAILTGGLSLLATGLSREETQTEAHCKQCGSLWHF